MSAEARVEELGVSDLDVDASGGLGEVDEAAFTGLAGRHRRELHVHCYRILGSFEDAEDAVQETFLRAWRGRETFEGRSTFRAWLYRIATNACLDLLAKRRPEPAVGGEVLWLQPYPDALLDELPALGAEEPEALGGRAGDDRARVSRCGATPCAASAGGANPEGRTRVAGEGRGRGPRGLGQLGEQRTATGSCRDAREPAGRATGLDRAGALDGEGDAETRDLVRRFTDACVATDIDVLAAMVTTTYAGSMPPTPGSAARSRGAGGRYWIESGFPGMTVCARWRSSNRQPAIAFYQWQAVEGVYLPLTLDVVRIADGKVAEIIMFHDDQFPRFGLPESLPADGTE